MADEKQADVTLKGGDGSPVWEKMAEEKGALDPLLEENGNRGVSFQPQEAPRHRYTKREPRNKSTRATSKMEKLLSGETPNRTVSKIRKISEVTFSPVGETDENQDRGNWDNPIEFFLSCLGYAVGLGNVWRFPYLVYRNGGGAFLIPYLIMLFLAGLPLMFMELSIGQYSSQGPLTVWKLCPLFKGIGITMVLLSTMCNIYYNVITGWALYYLVMSMRAVLPWACCETPWSGPNCVSFVQNTSICTGREAAMEWRNMTPIQAWTNSSKFAADNYFHNVVLAISDRIEDVGGVHLPVIIGLLVAWIIVFLVLMKGIKSFGKTVYFTSVFPYFILLALLIRACMEPGAVDGIKFYVTPKFEFLAKAQTWTDAAGQIFYSSGVCFGGVITLASYNKFQNNIYRDVFFIGIGNSLTSVFSGFVVFSILGFMAHSQNTTVETVATEGPGLTFIAYPQAVTLLSYSPVWSTLFFFMLSILALSSMFPTTENVISSIVDQFQSVLRPYKFWVTVLVCVFSFLAGIVICTNGGMYILELLNTYAVGYALLFLGLTETIVLAWRYGVNRIMKNIRRMLGPSKTLVFWKPLWLFVTPLLLGFAIIFMLIKSKPVNYGTYTYPDWSVPVGWFLCVLMLTPIPIYAVYKLVTFKRSEEGANMTCLEALNFLTLPSEKWCPLLPEFQEEDEESPFY